LERSYVSILGVILAQIQLLHLVAHDLRQMHGGWFFFANGTLHFEKCDSLNR
jgi:hypothetical protein